MTTLTYTDNYKDIFEHSILTTKMGAIVIFVMATIIYQIKFKNTIGTSTLFARKDTANSVLHDSLIQSTFSTLSVLLICMLRQFTLLQTFISCVVVFGILFAFEVSMESSGFNRFIASSEIKDGIGEYALMDLRIDSEEGLKESIANEIGGDPFLISLSYMTLLLLNFFIIFLFVRMIITTYYGYASGNTYVSNSKFLGGRINPYVGFSLELFFVFLLNALGPIASKLILSKEIDSKTYTMSAFLGIGSIILETMAQYSGMI
jgi:hypothetical protein